jgi:endoglycosylceramidase
LKPWGEYYFTKAVNKGFGHLWKNKHGLLDKLGNYWKKVAETFKDNPYVIGYELIN